MEGIAQPLSQGLSTFFGFVAQLIGAVVILVVGYVIGRWPSPHEQREQQSQGDGRP